MAASNRQGQALGWLATTPNTVFTATLNAAANWFAYSFTPDSGRTLSAARFYVSAVAGTLAAGDITCDLYDSAGTSGAPGAAIESGKLPSATITGAGWYDFTGFTTVLTAGQEYWLVLKNVNALPGTNFPTIQTVFSTTRVQLVGNVINRFTWGRATTTNSGGTWSSTASLTSLRVAYTDGYDGVPAQNTGAAAVGDGVYATRESGVKFTSPSNAVLKVAGLAMYVAGKTGTPTGQPRLGLWTGDAPPANLAYTAAPPATAITTQQWVYAYFATTQTLNPGTVTRVTLAETAQADASGNRYNNQETTWDSDANSLALLPFAGSCVKTYFDGATWTDTAGRVFPFALLLDTAGEFGAGAAGGGANLLGAGTLVA